MTNFENGLVLMIIGMGVVLTFLCLLIIAMRIMSKVIGYLNKIFPEAVEEIQSSVKKVSAGVDEAIAIAIAAIKAKRS